jgi:hypothetical protein
MPRILPHDVQYTRVLDDDEADVAAAPAIRSERFGPERTMGRRQALQQWLRMDYCSRQGRKEKKYEEGDDGFHRRYSVLAVCLQWPQ